MSSTEVHLMTSCIYYWQDKKSSQNEWYKLMEPAHDHAAQDLENHTWDQSAHTIWNMWFLHCYVLEMLSSNVQFEIVKKQREYGHMANTGDPDISMYCHEGKQPIGPSPFMSHMQKFHKHSKEKHAMKVWQMNLITHNNHTSLQKWWFACIVEREI